MADDLLKSIAFEDSPAKSVSSSPAKTNVEKSPAKPTSSSSAKNNVEKSPAKPTSSSPANNNANKSPAKPAIDNSQTGLPSSHSPAKATPSEASGTPVKCESLPQQPEANTASQDRVDGQMLSTIINVIQQETVSSVAEAEINSHVAASEEEPMDFEEEAMDVDEEITFNVRTPIKKQAHRNVLNKVNDGAGSTPTGRVALEIGSKEQTENGVSVSGSGEMPLNSQNQKGDASSDEEFMSADEAMEVDEVPTPIKPSQPVNNSNQKTPDKPSVQAKSPVQQAPSPPIKTNATADAKHTSQASPPRNNIPDENKKQDLSPERTPPKVGYSLNFDEMDLESMNPFAVKKSIVNSPDAGKAVTQPVEEKASEDKPKDVQQENKIEEKVDEMKEKEVEETKPVENSTANISPEKEPVTGVVNHDNKSDLKKTDPQNVEIQNTQENESTGTSYSSSPLKDTVPERETEDKIEKSVNEAKVEPVTADTVGSPALPVTRGAYNLDFLDNLEISDPNAFQTKTQIMNSPAAKDASKVGEEKPVPISEKQEKPPVTKPETPPKDETIKESTESSDENVKSEMQAGLIVEKDTMSSSKLEDKIEKVEDLSSANVIKTKTEEAMQSEVVSANMESKSSATPKTQEETDVEANLDDPFAAKTQLPNSPIIKPAGYAQIDYDNLDAIDPFKPKTQMQTSPAVKEAVSKLPDKNSTPNHVDPFKSSQQLPNSPVAKQSSNVSPKECQDDNNSGNKDHKPSMNAETFVKFEEDEQVEQKTSSESVSNAAMAFDDLDPFKPSKQMPNSLVSQKTADSKAKAVCPERKEAKTKATQKSKAKLDGVDPFADINPFQSKTKIANSPLKENSLTTSTVKQEIIDPFATQDKLASENPFQSPAAAPSAVASGVHTPTKRWVFGVCFSFTFLKLQ